MANSNDFHDKWNNNQSSRNKFSNTNGNRKRENDEPNEKPAECMQRVVYSELWITEGADATLPETAEILGEYMAKYGLTNSKIRSVYGEIKRIQMGRFENEKASFYLLRPKMAYILGRDKNNYGLQLFKIVFDKVFPLVKDHKTYQNFCNVIEAILAYHKAYGGKD